MFAITKEKPANLTDISRWMDEDFSKSNTLNYNKTLSFYTYNSSKNEYLLPQTISHPYEKCVVFYFVHTVQIKSVGSSVVLSLTDLHYIDKNT